MAYDRVRSARYFRAFDRRGVVVLAPAIIAAIVAAVVSAVGWLVNYRLSAKSQREQQRLTDQLRHVERQLEHLYGPLVFLIQEGRASFEDLLQTLGRNSVFIRSRPLTDDEAKLWLFWVDNDLMPRNAAVQSLLSTQSHLIVGDHIPHSYIRFIDHYNSWRVNHSRWKQEGIPYSWHSKVNWPREFEAEIVETFVRLKRQQARLIGVVTGASGDGA
jgi:hypothetical protein